eukprot:TRINITY_DN4865_c0_g1_i1.p1 TRINITY_DN4865_c0_g1~~TRINITY_DN4865_c0_g1_i1.p1  ORF type:complete len:895 (+),score=264.82 TRINITY_DN4865_c0_g1_i1:193-2877(+)
MATSEDVSEVLHSLGLSHLVEPLMREGIDDLTLLNHFSLDELKGIGIKRHGDRLKLRLLGEKGPDGVPRSAAEDVQKFFKAESSLASYCQQVLDQGLDSMLLLSLVSDADLKTEVGIDKAGPRKSLALKAQKRMETAGRDASPGHHNGMESPNDQWSGKGSPSTGLYVTGPDGSPRSYGVTGANWPGMQDSPAAGRYSNNGCSPANGEVNGSPGHPEREVEERLSSSGSLGKPARRLGLSRISEGDSSVGGDRPTSRMPMMSRFSPSNDDDGGLLDIGEIPARSSPRHFMRSNTSANTAAGGVTRRTSPYHMTDHSRPDNSKRLPSSKPNRNSTSSILSSSWKKPEPEPAAKGEKFFIRVFENGKARSEMGHLLFKRVPIPYGVTKMDVVYNIITRALGWNNANQLIYRQGGDAAGNKHVGVLWTFMGQQVDIADLQDNLWVVAGTANSKFCPVVEDKEDPKENKEKEKPKEKEKEKTTKKKAEEESISWAWERLSNPASYTGTAKDKHASAGTKRRTTGGYSSSTSSSYQRRQGIRNRVQDIKQQVSNEQKSAAPTGRLSTGIAGESPQKKDAAPTSTTTASNSATNFAPLLDHTLSVDVDDQGLVVPKDLESANRTRLLGWDKGALLGRGSFGMVYKGTLKDGLDVAVKLIEMGKQEKLGESPELPQLIREIKFIEQLEHPNIVKYYGCLFDEDHGQVQIFLQLMTGGSLASLTKKYDGHVPEHLCRKYTNQLLKGLEYLHARKVVHRDVKGANVLIDEHGDCAVADFGTAKCLDSMVSRQHGCTTMVGTPYWMAPEVITACDDGAYDTKVDVWSVGCTLVEMITGQPPWSGTLENMWAAMFHIARSTEPPPLPDDLPQIVKSFLIRVFERKASKRPSCTQLLADPWFKDMK